MATPVNWRKYGGINNFETTENLTVHIITADYLTLRNYYYGLFEISGNVVVSDSINVGKDLIVSGNIFGSQNLEVSNNFIIGNTLQVSKNLYLGSIDGSLNSNTPYFFGLNGNIGVNTTKPTYSLDVSGDNVHGLNVYSGNVNNINTISRNINNNGVVVSTDASHSYIIFFNDSAIDTSSNEYSTGIIKSSSEGIIDISSNVTNIYANHETNIYSTYYTNISAGITTSVNSKLSVSNRFIREFLKNETVVIYDISSGEYLLDVYEKGEKPNVPLFKTGNALSLVADNSFSNTFLNIITPADSALGLGIGGGSFPLDQTRSMSTMGLYDASGRYMPIETTVQGSSISKMRGTLGINTYAPVTDRYILDVNGPILITNGEIQPMYDASFQINYMAFLRYDHASKAVGFGTPIIDNNAGITSNPTPYSYNFVYSNNGGQTWNYVDYYKKTTLVSVEDTYFATSPTIMNCAFIYDENNIMACGQTAFTLVSYDGGLVWYQMSISNIITDIKCVQLFRQYNASYFNPSEKQVLVVYVDSVNNGVYYFHMDSIYAVQNVIHNQGASMPTITDTSDCSITHAVPITVGPVRSMDGFDASYVFVAGENGIQKLLINPSSYLQSNSDHGLIPDITHVSGRPYNFVRNLNNTDFTIFAGDGVMTYTKDGNTFTDVVMDVSFGSVDIFDMNIAIAITNDICNVSYGRVYYTLDGANSWIPMSNEFFNSSGNANSITHLFDYYYAKLGQIYFYDKHSFVISSVVSQYDDTTNTNYAFKSNGYTKIFHCYMPDLFDHENNTILDACGNIRVFGNVDVYDNINLNKELLVDGNTRLQSALYVDKDVSMNANLYIENRLTVIRDTTLNSNLVVSQDASMNGNVYIRRKTVLAQDVSMNANLWVAQDASLNGGLFVRSNIVALRDISLNGNMIIGANLYLNSNVLVASNIEALSDISLNGNLWIGMDASLNGKLWVSDYSTFMKDASLNGNLWLAKDASLNGKLWVKDYSTFMKDASLNGNLWLAKDASLSGNVWVKGNAILNKDVSMNANAFVLGNSTVVGNMIVYQDISLNGALKTNSDLNINGNLTIKNDARVYGTLYTNNMDLSGATALNGGGTINIGTIGSGKTINIGGPTVGGVPNFIRIGQSTQDTISIAGNITFDEASTSGNVFQLNTGVLGNGISSGSGITIRDYNFNRQAYFLTNNTFDGFVFKSAASPTVFDLDVSGFVLGNDLYTGSQIGSGIIAIKKTAGSLAGDASYVSFVPQFDISNIFFKDAALSTPTKQYITSNVDISGITKIYGGSAESTGLYSGALQVSGGVSIVKNTYVGGNADISGNVNLRSSLYVATRFVNYSDTSLNGNLWLAKDASFGGNLLATKKITGMTDASVNGNLNLGMNASIGGNTDIGGNLTVAGFMKLGNIEIDLADVSMNGNIFVGLDSSLNGRLFVGDAIVGMADVSFNGNLWLAKDASFGGNLLVKQRMVGLADTSLNGNLWLAKDVSLNGKLWAKDAATFMKDASLNGNLWLAKDASLNANLWVSSNVTLLSDLSLNGNAFLKTEVDISGNLVLHRNFFAVGDVSLNGNLNMNGTLGVHGNTTIDGSAVLMNSNVAVGSGYTTNVLGKFNVAPSSTLWGSYSDLSSNLVANRDGYIQTLNPNYGLAVGFNEVSVETCTVDLYCNGGLTPATNNYGGLTISSFSTYQDLITLFYITNNLCYFNIGGNVGIGTKVPSQKLDVSGGCNIGGNLQVFGSFYIPTVGANVDLQNAGNINLTGGNAIATTEAITDSSAKLSTTAFVKNVINSNILYGFTVSGDLINEDNANTSNRLRSTDISNIVYAGYLTNPTGNFKSEGSFVVGGSSTFSGNYYPYQWRMSVGGYPASEGYLTSGYDQYNAKRLRIIDVSGTVERMTIDQYGNVGLGTRAPAYTLDICGNARVMSAVSSTSPTSGAFIVSGGVGIGGDLYLGGRAMLNAAVGSTNISSGTLIVTGGVGISGNMYSGGTIYVSSNAASTSTTSGGIVVTGGVGVSGNVYIGEVAHLTNAVSATSATTGALVVSGGVGVGGNAHIGGNLYLSATSSTSATTGALVVSGGVGVGGNVHIGEFLNVDNAAASTSSTSGAVIVSGGIGVGGNVHVAADAAINGNLYNAGINFMSKISETITNTTVAGTNLTLDYMDTSVIYYITNSITGNMACYITNVPAITNKTYTLSVIIPAKFCITSVYVNGSPYTLNCNGGFSNVGLSNGNVIVQQLAVLYANDSVIPQSVITSVGAYS
jgi:UDP-3-O-[3-hydroxymyristoyl] glucosamine N-acyltransferase